jgi:protein phosphatase
VDLRTYAARAGDVFLLCSDGLTSMIGESRVAELMRDAGSLKDAGKRLIREANEAGGRDNITVVLFELEEVGGGAAAATNDEGTTTAADPSAANEQATGEIELPQPSGEPDPRSPVMVGRSTEERGSPVSARRPSEGRRSSRRFAKLGIVVVLVLTPLVGGAWIASRAVYFVGANDIGTVTVYRGLPYELPGGISLYESFYSSGVTASQLGRRRDSLLDHRLRSRDDAVDLVRSLERGEIDQ